MFEGDGWEEEEAEERGVRKSGEAAGAASVAFGFLLKQSYICALIAMMAWSITYVSWLTCVLLLWSCVLWMMRERRRYTLMSSPWLVAYGNLLVILQYVYSFQAVQEVPGLFPSKGDPCRELASKVLHLRPPLVHLQPVTAAPHRCRLPLQLLCLLTFWLLLRQALTEKRDGREDGRQASALSTVSVHVEGEAPASLQSTRVAASSPEGGAAVLQMGSGSTRTCRRRRRRCRTRRCCSSTGSGAESRWKLWPPWSGGCSSNTGSTSVEPCSSLSASRAKSSFTKSSTWSCSCAASPCTR